MHLANIWFGQHALDLPSQLQQAAEMGFEGVGLLSGGVSRGISAGLEAHHTESSAVVAVSLDQILAPQEPSMESFQWRESDVDVLLRRLKKLRCAQLVVPSGLDARPQSADNGEEILVRVRGGETISQSSAEAVFFHDLPSLGWEQQVSRLAAFLYQLRQQAPGLRVAIAPNPSPAGLLNPVRFAVLQEEIGNLNIGYWHDSGAMETRSLTTGEAPGQWLDSFSNIMQGSTLHDFSGGMTMLPPGLGQVDWQLLREYMPRAATQVLAVAPSYPGEVLAESRSDLESRLQP